MLAAATGAKLKKFKDKIKKKSNLLPSFPCSNWECFCLFSTFCLFTFAFFTQSNCGGISAGESTPGSVGGCELASPGDGAAVGNGACAPVGTGDGVAVAVGDGVPGAPLAVGDGVPGAPGATLPGGAGGSVGTTGRTGLVAARGFGGGVGTTGITGLVAAFGFEGFAGGRGRPGRRVFGRGAAPGLLGDAAGGLGRKTGGTVGGGGGGGGSKISILTDLFISSPAPVTLSVRVVCAGC